MPKKTKQPKRIIKRPDINELFSRRFTKDSPRSWCGLFYVTPGLDILFVQENDDEKYWSCLGGRPNIGETFKKACGREGHEESGREPTIMTPASYYVGKKKVRYIGITFCPERFEPDFTKENEHIDYKWVSHQKLKDNTRYRPITPMDPAIRAILFKPTKHRIPLIERIPATIDTMRGTEHYVLL